MKQVGKRRGTRAQEGIGSLCAVVAAAAMVQGCGGGASETAGVAQATRETAQALAAPAAVAASAPTLTLSSPRRGRLPFTVGQPLARGDVPEGSALVAEDGAAASLQFVVQNRWPDGSAKIAVISGYADFAQAGSVTLALKKAPAPSAAPAVSTARLQDLTASIDFGAYGSASWSAADWSTPQRQIVAGPLMSTWTFRKPIGADAHLVAWLEVRAYADGQVEVLPWIENGYVKVAAPGDRAGLATFTLGGTVRFSQQLSLLNHTRAVLAGDTPDGDGRNVLTHWWWNPSAPDAPPAGDVPGHDPQVVAAHDTAYFIGTRLVPNYIARPCTGVGKPDAGCKGPSALFSRLHTAYVPTAQHDFPGAMGTSGYHPSIGFLPEWDVAYLTSGADPRAYRAVVANGYAAGRYSVHFRDENTQRPVDMRLPTREYMNISKGSNLYSLGSSHKGNYTAMPVAGSLTPPTFKVSHHPSMGYVAYLVTGWNYFVEELQFVATADCMTLPSSLREGASCVSKPGNLPINSQTRSAAWILRSYNQVATITPDADELRPSFVNMVDATIGSFHRQYVAQRNNPLGLMEATVAATQGEGWQEPTDTPQGPWQEQWQARMWMEDFLTGSIAYLRELDSCSPSVRPQLEALMAWKFRSVVGRLGNGPDEFPYPYGAQYNVPFAPSRSADFATGKGPWYSNWGQVARAIGIQPGYVTPGSPLVTGNPGNPTAYWGNMMPALSYAVDHRAVGAAEAWRRVSSAPNFKRMQKSADDQPVWGIAPRTMAPRP